MKTKSLIALIALAGVSPLSMNAEVIYPGCSVPPVECCVCDVLPDLYNYGVMFGAAGCETRKIVFSGFIQTDYQFIDVDNRAETAQINAQDKITGEKISPTVDVQDPSEVNNFSMRRVRLITEAILDQGWKGVIQLDFFGKEDGFRFISPADAVNQTITTENKQGIFGVADVYIEKYCANQFFRFGQRKVRFGYEELTPDYEVKNIERSIASKYFSESIQPSPLSGSALGFDSRHVGIFWDGSYKKFNYGVSLVNGFQGTKNCSDLTDNELGIFGGIGYASTFNCLDVEIGINAGFIPKGNARTLLLPNQVVSEAHKNSPAAKVGITDGIGIRASIGGINPYITLRWNGWYVMGEILAAKVQKGQANGVTDATPIGWTLAPSYMWNDCLELAFRASFLDTDFRGTRISSVIRCAPDTTVYAGGIGPFFAGDVYNKAREFYFGFNYYWLNKAMMLSAGYEWAQFRDRATTTIGDPVDAAFRGPKTNVHQIRARLQLVF